MKTLLLDRLVSQLVKLIVQLALTQGFDDHADVLVEAADSSRHSRSGSPVTWKVFRCDALLVELARDQHGVIICCAAALILSLGSVLDLHFHRFLHDCLRLHQLLRGVLTFGALSSVLSGLLVVTLRVELD